MKEIEKEIKIQNLETALVCLSIIFVVCSFLYLFLIREKNLELKKHQEKAYCIFGTQIDVCFSDVTTAQRYWNGIYDVSYDKDEVMEGYENKASETNSRWNFDEKINNELGKPEKE